MLALGAQCFKYIGSLEGSSGSLHGGTQDVDVSFPERNVHVRLCQFVTHDGLIRRKIEIYLTGDTKIRPRQDGVQTLDAPRMIDRNLDYCDLSLTQQVTQLFKIAEDFNS